MKELKTLTDLETVTKNLTVQKSVYNYDYKKLGGARR